MVAMKRFVKLGFWSALCCSNLAMASVSGEWQGPIFFDWHPVVSVGGGLSLTTNPGQLARFSMSETNPQFFDYAPNPSTQTAGLFEALAGAESVLFSLWLFQLDVAFSQTGAYTFPGTLTQGTDIDSAQYAEQFSVVTRQLMLQSKVLFPYKNRLFPYFLAGLGGASNTAYSFTAAVPSSLSTQTFANNTESSFAYRLGVGLDADVLAHFRVGIAYRFTELGAVKLGAASLNQGTLQQKELFANELLGQITYRL